MMSESEAKKMADRPLNELLTRDMVDIYVGPQSTHWILHEKLLCARSSFFRKTFYTSQKPQKSSNGSSTPPSQTKSLGLEEDDDEAFTAFVAWLYSSTVPPAHEEKDLAMLFELYLMSERWGIAKLQHDTLATVRAFYHKTATYPGLRRVQYVYANTEPGSAMRELLVGSVARMLVLGEGGKDGSRRIPLHWDKALRKNGQLAVDLISRIQAWELPREEIPDVRESDEEDETGSGEKDGQKPHAQKQEKSEKPMKQENGDERENKKSSGENAPNGLTNGADHSESDE